MPGACMVMLLWGLARPMVIHADRASSPTGRIFSKLPTSEWNDEWEGYLRKHSALHTRGLWEGRAAQGGAVAPVVERFASATQRAAEKAIRATCRPAPRPRQPPPPPPHPPPDPAGLVDSGGIRESEGRAPRREQACFGGHGEDRRSPIVNSQRPSGTQPCALRRAERRPRRGGRGGDDGGRGGVPRRLPLRAIGWSLGRNRGNGPNSWGTQESGGANTSPASRTVGVWVTQFLAPARTRALLRAPPPPDRTDGGRPRPAPAAGGHRRSARRRSARRRLPVLRTMTDVFVCTKRTNSDQLVHY
eukprot:gene10930-biopygen10684